MRKIKKLEEKIDELEISVGILETALEHRYTLLNTIVKGLNKKSDEFIEKVNKQEKMLQEQDEFLKENVCPFIAEKLAEDLSDHLKGLGDVLADLLTEEPKKTAKSVKKGTENTEKNVGKKTNKAKKENK